MKKSLVMLFFAFVFVGIIPSLGDLKVFAADPSDIPPSAVPSTYTVPVTGIPTQLPTATDTPSPTPQPFFEPELSPWLFIIPGIVLFVVIIF